MAVEQAEPVESVKGDDPSWANLRRDLQLLGKDIARLGEKHLTGGQDAIAEQVSQLRDMVGEMVGKVSEQGQSQLDGLLGVVRRRPVATIAGLFATGLVLSALLSRRS